MNVSRQLQRVYYEHDMLARIATCAKLHITEKSEPQLLGESSKASAVYTLCYSFGYFPNGTQHQVSGAMQVLH